MNEFGIRYHPVLRPVMQALGMGARSSGITVTPEELRARMGWAFRASIPLPDVVDAAPARIPLVLGIGVHGWGGRWAMNGARTGGVRIEVDPPCRARVCGFPVRLRTLWVSLTDPEGFLAALPPDRRGTAA